MARLLLVDDDDHVLRSLAMALAVDDHRIELLDGPSAGDDLRTRFDDDPPDLVVLARDLPDGDALAVVADLRAHAGWSQVPVVVVSCDDSDEATWSGWRAGVSSYVAPPPAAPRLRDIVVAQLVAHALG